MAFTFQHIADRARIPLNDADKVTHPDSELLSYGVDAYLLLRRYRPDLFLSQYDGLPAFGSLALDSDFPVAMDELLPIVADYATARAEFKTDESTIKERAQAFFGLFTTGVRG